MASATKTRRQPSRDRARPPEGELIYQARKAQRLNQKAVGAMVGVTGTWVGVLESGEKSNGEPLRPRPVTIDTYARIAAALGMTAQEWTDAAAITTRLQSRRLMLAVSAKLRVQAAASGAKDPWTARMAPTIPDDLDVEQVISLLALVRRMCSDEVFRRAVDYGAPPPTPPIHSVRPRAS